MKNDLIFEALKNLNRSGVKTFLTLLGIVIGIAAIVSLVSIGSGLGVAVEQQLDQLGGKIIFVIPGGYQNFRTTLDTSDVSNIEAISGVESVIPIYSSTAVLEFDNEKINVSINAVDSEKISLFESTGFFDIQDGRSILKNESSAITIGNNIAQDFFEKKIDVRNLVKINDEEYRVVGILKAQTQSFGGGPNTSSSVFMSIEAFKRISSVLNPAIIFVNAVDKKSVEGIVEEIEDYTDKRHGEKSVSVMSSDSILEMVNSMLSMITLFVIGLAGISLVVGGIGIMNAMITSVLERTKEIGLLKALGASNNKILTLFLLESAFIGLIGGIIGIILGFSIAEIIAIIGTQSGFSLYAVKSIEIVFGAISFSMIVGMLSGFYPARRAANLDPVEALRYE